VQRVTGKSLAEWSQDSLFVPLGMNDTEWRDDYRRVVKGRATAYSPVRSGAWQQDMPFTMVYGNGGLLTSIPDMLKWNDALTAGTAPLTSDVVKQLETPRPLTDGAESNYALGLTVDTYRGVREVSHGGATAGYRTFLARWPDKGLSVAVFCNAGSADAGGYAHQIGANHPRTARGSVPAGSGRRGWRRRYRAACRACGATLPTTGSSTSERMAPSSACRRAARCRS
jgi:CubicO group peptidase (beta-lactamase class C family)